MYAIRFMANGIEQTIWSGYADYYEARMAVRECDLVIPMDWTWDILPEDQLTQHHK